MSILINLLKPVLKYYINRQAKKSLPDYNETIQTDLLTADVQIIRDKWAVPHIYAQNQSDLFFAQGYVHAQERLWQMELTRRVVAGRLCEVVGKDALAVDKIARRLGLAQLAKQDHDKYRSHEFYQYLVSYVNGVNHYIDHCGNLPVEFKLLKHSPEAWTLEDSLGMARLVALQMAQGWLHELDRLSLVEKYGLEKAAELFPEYPAQNPVALKYGLETFQKGPSGLEAFQGPYLSPLGGSNNWVVAADKMEHGAAVLCNDPHLLINTPNIWFENHLDAPDYKNTGVSMPGVPLVLIGHNDNIAWGATLTYADIQDTYIEKFTTSSSIQYQYGDRILKAEVREEVIQLKKEAAPHIERVVTTIHGPVLANAEKEERIVLKSKALMDNDMILGFYHLNTAKNWNDFVGACKLLSFPSLNLVYADVEDNIGYYMTGEVPIRNKKKGLLPSSGVDLDNEWTGVVPFEKMPHVLNPQQGYFFTCNHKIVADDFPYDLGNIWMNGYRAQTLERYFQSKDSFSMEDFEKWQLDFYCPPGKEFADFFNSWRKDCGDLPIDSIQLLDLLANWDFDLTKDTIGGTVYQVLKQEISNVLLGNDMSFKGHVEHDELPVFMHTEFFGHDTTALLRLLANPTSAWWEGAQEDKLKEALVNTHQFLKEKLGAETKGWKWGLLHQMDCKHSLGIKEPLDEIFNNADLPIGGDTDTLCQIGFVPSKHYGGSMVAASFRQIIDMGNLRNSKCIMPVGQSGNVKSPHYADQLPMWAKGEFKPMLWHREDIEKYAIAKALISKL